MHILLLPSWYPDSSQDVKGVFFRDQALALRKHGHRVGVVAPRLRSLRTLFQRNSSPSPRYFELDEQIPTFRKEVFALLPRLPSINFSLLNRVTAQVLGAYISEHGRPDLIHAHCALYGGASAAEVGQRLGIPVVLTEHSSAFARGLLNNWQMRLAEITYSRSASCIAVSPALGELLGQCMPSSQGRWKWIPNIVADRFCPAERGKRKDGEVRYLNLAMMTKNKGQLDLLMAFCKSVQQGLEGELWLAGDGPIRNELASESRRLGISDRVKFLGLVSPDKVPDLLSQVDAMVVSSHYETFGVVAAEALMAGVPVIATKSGGPECIVLEGDGELVSPSRPEDMSRAISEMAEVLQTYDSAEISSRAKKRFGGEAIAQQLTAEYERVLHQYGADGS